MIGAHRRGSDQPEGFDESSGAARLYRITPEISFGRARRLSGERFEALAASPVRVASIVALSAGRSASRTSRAARKLPIEYESNRWKRARVRCVHQSSI